MLTQTRLAAKRTAKNAVRAALRTRRRRLMNRFGETVGERLYRYGREVQQAEREAKAKAAREARFIERATGARPRTPWQAFRRRLG